MKVAIVFGVITLTLGGLLIWQGEQEDKQCIEQWLANTKDLFENATAVFSGSGSNLPEEQSETEVLDQKLQELLPVESTAEINWDVAETDATVNAVREETNALLPNLFNEKNQTKTTVSGQLHLDDSDNIVGAEVNVEIPTN